MKVWSQAARTHRQYYHSGVLVDYTAYAELHRTSDLRIRCLSISKCCTPPRMLSLMLLVYAGMRRRAAKPTYTLARFVGAHSMCEGMWPAVLSDIGPNDDN